MSCESGRAALVQPGRIRLQRTDQRFSKAFDGTTGCAPAIAVPRGCGCAEGAAAAATGFGAGLDSAARTGAGGFGAACRTGGWLVRACLGGCAAGGRVEAVGALSEPPKPIRLAMLEKNPPDSDDEAVATRTLAGAACGFGAGAAAWADLVIIALIVCHVEPN